MLFVLLLVSASCHAADGIVLLADKSPVSVKINHARLISRENDNSRFQLTLDRTKPFPHDYGKMALVIGKSTILFTSGGYHSPTNHTVGAVIPDEALADAVAKHVKVKAVKRSHPGHQLVVRFNPTASAFKAGKDGISRTWGPRTSRFCKPDASADIGTISLPSVVNFRGRCCRMLAIR
ncbi:MAG: hypothetical protein ACPGVU_15495 [Limisphaerales bacterium]